MEEDQNEVKNIEEKIVPPKKIIRKGTVTAGLLNLRSEPNISAEIISVMKKGCIVLILSSKDSEFYKVNYNNIEGYCCKEYIREVK